MAAPGSGNQPHPGPGAANSHVTGYTVIEILFVVGVAATLAAIAVPQSWIAVDSARAGAAARYLASRMAAARAQAVMRSAHVALRFDEGADGITFQVFVDGNRNGVLTADIALGADTGLEPAVRIGDLFPGTAIAVTGGAGADPVRLGGSNLLSFTPLGTSTSGSIFVRGRDGSQFAIRVLGATGRARVQRFIARDRSWIDAF